MDHRNCKRIKSTLECLAISFLCITSCLTYLISSHLFSFASLHMFSNVFPLMHVIFHLWPLILSYLISSNLFFFASILIRCNIFASSPFVIPPFICFHSLSSHLTSSHSHHFTTYLVTSFLCFFHPSATMSPFILPLSHQFSSHLFSFASLEISCNILPLFLFIFHLSPLTLSHLTSSLLIRIPSNI